MKKWLGVLAFLWGCYGNAFAQIELNSFSVAGRGGVMNTFVNDYQAIGVNPGNLGRSTSTVSFTIGEGGVGGSSQALTRTTIDRFMGVAEGDELTLQDRRDLAKAFTNENVLNVGADFNAFAVSVNLPKLGSFALSNRQRALSHIAFNKNLSELVFLGQDSELYQDFEPGQTVFVSQIFEGTEIKASWVNEWNVAYGRKIIDLPTLNIHAGVGYRYIQGMALYEFSAIDGEVKAHNAAAGIFDIDYNKYLTDPNFNYNDARGLLDPIGRGHGIDVGLSAEINKMFKVGISVTDIGKMTWTDNLLQAQDKGFKLPEFDGTDEYDFEDAAEIIETIIDSALVLNPASEIKTDLPTRLRTGIGVKIGERVEVGLDYVHALNNAPGNITQDFVGLGVDVTPVSFFRLSTGVSTGAGDKVNLPIGITIVTSAYEFGVATRDITAPFTENNPGASIVMGTMRFKIGKPKEI